MTATAAQAYAAQRHFMATITPSGNTVVERVTLGVAAHLPQVSMHFSRTPVFGSSDPSPDGYATDGLLAAARLLAHAAPQVIVWNGSKGAGIGFEHDRALVAAIEAGTGIRATTSILGLEALLRSRGIRRLGLVTPYSTAGQKKTIDCLAREGFDCVAEASAGLSDNLSYASVPLEQVATMARQVAELGLPVYDSTALGVWHGLRLAGVDTAPAAAAWGSLFALPA
jgi:maleate isomerase